MSGAMGRPAHNARTARGARAKIAAGALALAMVAPGIAAATSAVDLYYERALMVAATGSIQTRSPSPRVAWA